MPGLVQAGYASEQVMAAAMLAPQPPEPVALLLQSLQQNVAEMASTWCCRTGRHEGDP